MTDAVRTGTAGQYEATVLENRSIAERTFRIRLECPGLAAAIRPGQFVMVRTGRTLDPLLGRPFALYEVHRDPQGVPKSIDLVYLVLGRGTEALSRVSVGDRLSCWGPLGNGFSDPPRGDVVFVAGGIGQTPFLSLGRWWKGDESYAGIERHRADGPRSIRLLYGVRSKSLLAGLDDFERAGIPVQVATDDGSAGHQGFATDLLEPLLTGSIPPALVIGCGPSPMLRTLARRLAAAGCPGLLSLENHMACGFGVCFSCVAPILQDDGSSDLRRVCVEGPIFDAARVVWS
ncbi:MAG: dihydroorotate dehydrogenase electron transfer subunit [Isosphaeraceae bacterium]|nr:dihydroorotate dehydrogenase electron transfer subunit [Isosphaeraceae bacterium]